ncbi:DUF2062 domain-containing protein [uncultured Hydrogenophaga sp.]|uniref:DUF2062 domain-containing protein n=1 Tax=uncultured Hydrogenophaga sp. TaxID=199683 RepID=UPI00265F62B0|nr:DUF2062 domain-containing protein [uncultured Hydrogenophaga sp.]
MERFKRWLPDRDAVRSNRWLRWMGPALYHPALWSLRRRGFALGMALGIFFGLLIPVAQIPLSAFAAVMLRAYVPAAIASTLVTNPVTFGPVYFAAWKLGGWMLGDGASGVGGPLVVGLATMAVLLSTLTYALVTTIWRWRVLRKRRLRMPHTAA